MVSSIVPTFNNHLPHVQPNHPTLSAFGRASTLSLGSIAFGSLIVTLLELLRLILNAVRNNANQNGHREYHSLNSCIVIHSIPLLAVEVCLACCAECFIGCIESMVQYFNRYAELFNFSPRKVDVLLKICLY